MEADKDFHREEWPTQLTLMSKSLKEYLSQRSRSMLFISLALLYACEERELGQHNDDTHIKSASSIEASEELFDWLSERVELMVQHKANCTKMAEVLIRTRESSRAKLKNWHYQLAGKTLAQKAISDPDFGRQLNQLIMKGDLVYSYCAYQSPFRDRLRSLRE